MKMTLFPDDPTDHRCDACQQLFPAGTLVKDRGRFVCQKCYDTMNPPDEPIDESLLCHDALLAFKLSLWGFACFALGVPTIAIFHVVSFGLFIAAIMMAIMAKREIKTRPELKGLKLANSALVISITIPTIMGVAALAYYWQYRM